MHDRISDRDRKAGGYVGGTIRRQPFSKRLQSIRKDGMSYTRKYSIMIDMFAWAFFAIVMLILLLT